MRNSVLVAMTALALAAPAAAQTNPPSSANMPVAPPGLGERITMGTQTFEPAVAPPSAYQLAPSQLAAVQIRQLQQGLRAQGYPLRRIDGVFGPETAAALQDFQQRQNIASAPGQVDARTLGLLGVTAAPGAMPGSGLSTPLAGTATRGRGIRP